MSLRTLLSFGLLVVTHASAIEKRQAGRDGILNYVCMGHKSGDMPEICANMCYAIMCRGFSSTLYWDRPSENTKRERARQAGCGTPNRCSQPPYGPKMRNSCDEFPFRSVQRDSDALPVNRCVPAEQNRAQGNILKNFYHSFGDYKGVGLDDQPGSFRISFANAGVIQYCGSDPDCRADGNEFTVHGEITVYDPERRDVRRLETYITVKGQVIRVPGGAAPGDRVWTPKSYGDDTDFDLDFVVGPANQTGV